MTAQALTGTCAGVATCTGAATNAVSNNPHGATFPQKTPLGGYMGKGSTALASHVLWTAHTTTSPPARTINPPYWPITSGQGWPRAKRSGSL